MNLPKRKTDYSSKETQHTREQLKNMSSKERLSYFWYYYRVHTFIAVAVVVALGFFIKDLVTKKDIALNVIMINTMAKLEEEKIADEYLPLINLTPDKHTIYIDASPVMNPDDLEASNLAYVQKITAMVFARELDVMLLDESAVDYYLANNFFGNLEDLLSPDLIQKHHDKFLYRDYTDPDTNETKSIPMAINISDSPKLKEWNVVAPDDIYFTILSNSEKLPNAAVFLNYLYQD